MKRTALLSILLLTSAMAVLAGCDPTLINERSRRVRFTAVSKASPATKTAYTRQGTSGGKTYQTISWTEGDIIRVYCPKDEAGGITGYNEDTTTWTETGQQFNLNYVYADYTIKDIDNSSFPQSKATLENVDPNGLFWNGSDAATFYAAYPYGTAICSSIDNRLRFAVQIPAGNFGTSVPSVQTGDSTDVKNMPLLAIQKNVGSGSEVNLDFYPAFSAYEFVLKSADETTLTVDWFELFTDTDATNEYLTGICYYDLNALSGDSHFLPNNALSFDEGGKSIKINVNQPASLSTQASFTLFTLPCTFNQLSIRVAFTPEGGSQMTKTLKLKQNGEWISFPAGHKARIIGLALDGGSRWQLTIDDQVLPWIEDEQTTSFRHQIGITNRTPVSGYLETEEVNEPGGPVNWDKYYTRLTVDCGASDPCIVFKFKPTAPIGGYWRLKPEDVIPGSLNYFHITTSDMINGESERLQGQVMVQDVYIYIRPTAEYLALDPAPVYSIIIHCDMSPSVTFDPLYSADSEFQRPQSDGRFSYYKFVIAK